MLDNSPLLEPSSWAWGHYNRLVFSCSLLTLVQSLSSPSLLDAGHSPWLSPLCLVISSSWWFLNFTHMLLSLKSVFPQSSRYAHSTASLISLLGSITGTSSNTAQIAVWPPTAGSPGAENSIIDLSVFSILVSPYNHSTKCWADATSSVAVILSIIGFFLTNRTPVLFRNSKIAREIHL